MTLVRNSSSGPKILPCVTTKVTGRMSEFALSKDIPVPTELHHVAFYAPPQ